MESTETKYLQETLHQTNSKLPTKKFHLIWRSIILHWMCFMALREESYFKIEYTHVDMNQSTITELNLEYLSPWQWVRWQCYDPPTLFVFTVAFHIKHAVEFRFCNVYLHLNTVRQTAHNHLWSWEHRSKRRRLIWEIIDIKYRHF